MALLPTALTLWLLPPISARYSIIAEPFNRHEPHIVFEDLNGDGEEEYISTEPFHSPYYGRVHIANKNVNLYDQWNIVDSVSVDVAELFIGDYDNDSLKEIYVCSKGRDSVFLNVNEFFDSAGLRLNSVFITGFGHKSQKDITVYPIGMFDRNGDGKKEYYFSITTGYGLWPRLLYAYDLENKTLKTSPYTSINIHQPIMRDITGDGKPEIFGRSNANGNHHIPTPYSDYSSWVMVFNADLELLFKPIELDGFSSNQDIEGIYNPDFKGFVVSRYANPSTSTGKSGIMILDTAGQVLREKSNEDLQIGKRPNIKVLPYKGKERIVVFSDPILLLNENLEEVDKIPMPVIDAPLEYGNPNPSMHDFNNDNQDDLLLQLSEREFAIFWHDLTFIGTFKTDVTFPEYTISSVVVDNVNKTLIKPFTEKGLLISVKENPYFWLFYLIFPATYLGFAFFLLVVQKIAATQIQKQELQKRRIQELQLRSIKGQLDPHFTFNALNAIGSMLQLEDRNVAYDYLSKFTRLLRQLIEDSEKIWRPLREELAFVTAYLQLEKIRFEEKFDFGISVAPSVSQDEHVPIMCIQIFAENALRHGIMPLEAGGLIQIDIHKESNTLIIVITDNGVGRKRAHQDGNGTGRGLKMTQEFYEILNQSSRHKVEFNIHDGQPTGTVVKLSIPQ